MLRYCATLCFSLLLIFHAAAHEVQPSIATLSIKPDRTFSIVIETNLEALLTNIGSEHEDTDDSPAAAEYNALRELPPAALSDKFKTFSPQYTKDLGLSFDGTGADINVKGVTIPEVGDTDLARDSLIELSGKLPDTAEKLSWAYPKQFGSSVLRVERPGQEVEAEFLAAGASFGPAPVGVAVAKSWWEKAWTYIVIGFTHILPKGLDHILFVLGLFLLSLKWRPLLVQVTAFTLAHSVTLGLGLYGLVSVSPSIVEPLIALSIVYVGIENIFTRQLHVWRPVIVFLFGLLHGLGFAGILTEIGLPKSEFVLGLISFNVGVEAGQLAVIALAFLLVGWFASKPWYRERITIPASIAIAAMGAWWFVERTLL